MSVSLLFKATEFFSYTLQRDMDLFLHVHVRCCRAQAVLSVLWSLTVSDTERGREAKTHHTVTTEGDDNQRRLTHC